MHPILFKYGFIEIRFYGLMYVVAILTATWIIKHEVRRKAIAISEDDVMNLIVWTVIGGVVGARLYYVVFNLGYYLSDLKEIPAIWHGGLAIHGGLIGGISVAWFYLRRRSVAFWRMADAVAPSLILGQAFGRFGNFMNGDAHGAPTDMPWGIVFPPESIAGRQFPGVPLHPTMLYEMFFNLCIFAFIWLVLRRREHRDGYIFAMYVALYSVGRFVVEHFRADSLMFGSLRAAQMASIGISLVALAVIIAGRLWETPGEKKTKKV
ncbi:MAG: prolipoprotein diacylglyceryl transferase [Deltaproteobacteria bacterium]|nr:prolipoprotein diacylglyceryl transferase [Deltaproteobacteria bacterium]